MSEEITMDPTVMKLVGAAGDHVRWWCPGCDDVHIVPVNAAGVWDWNGSVDAPTLSPSILVQSIQTLINPDLQEPALTDPSNRRWTPVCHSFMRSGRIEFLSDCTHSLAGQTVPMAPWTRPDDW